MKLSIITPTYNRAHLLPVLYKSLTRQTCKDFEWIVIDDGSTDNTDDLILQWKDEADFDVIFVRKENGGKHTALNASHPYIHSNLVLIADSDDWLVDEAVQTIVDDWKRFEDDCGICGISYLRGSDPEHSLGGRHYRKPEEISDFITIKVNDSSDCGSCETIRADVFKEYPFPEYPDEKFIGESYLWFNAGYKYKTVYIDKILYITEFFDDGLTRAGRKLRYNSPNGSMIVANYGTARGIKNSFRVKQAILYNCYAYKTGTGFVNRMKQAKSKVMTCIGIIPGYLLYKKWENTYTNH